MSQVVVSAYPRKAFDRVLHTCRRAGGH